MKTKPNTEEKAPNTGENTEVDPFYATDDKGNRIPDEDIISAGTKPQIVEFRVAGQNHKLEILMSQVSLEARQAPQLWFMRFLAEKGVNLGKDDNDDPEANAEFELAEKEASTHPERLRLRAELAIEALTVNGSGRVNVSIPQFRDGLTAQKLVEDSIFGHRVINLVNAKISDFFGV